jgi:hypothetical protein
MQQENTPILLILFGLIIVFVIYRKIVPMIIKPNLKKQYELFDRLGLRLNDMFDLSDLLVFEDKDVNFKKYPYKLLYITLGLKSENKNNQPFSNDCLTIDMESIEDSGCYSDILKDIARITKGDMDFKNISDIVDIENQTVNVSFSLMDNDYSWDLKYDYDWIDMNFFVKVQSLTDDIDSDRKFNIFVDGQDIVLGYNTLNDLHEIKSKTKLKIIWI